MALEEGVGGAQGVHRFVDGVYKDGRPAGEALFGDEIIAAQRGLQAAGPAFLLIEADPAVGTVRRIGTVAVGVAVTQAENMFFHGSSSCSGVFHGLAEIIHSAYHSGVVVELSRPDLQPLGKGGHDGAPDLCGHRLDEEFFPAR